MNIMVTGANGQLGNEMRILAASPQYTDSYIFTDVVEVEGLQTSILDICDSQTVSRMVDDNAIDCIVNCAAFTNVERAETEEALAEKLNACAPAILASAMARTGGLLVHISTDYVFGKEPYNVPCREDQTGTPTGAYGRTKLHGEQHIIASGCDHVIIRTAWLYSEFGKNFMKTMYNLTASKPQLSVVFDQTGTPTYALDLAAAIMAVLDDYRKERAAALAFPVSGEKAPSYSKAGIYHFSNEGVCSWFDFTKMIAEYSGHLSCEIKPCHSSEFPSAVVRPAYSVLDKTKIKETFGLPVPYWTDSLKKCIESYEQMTKH